VLAFEPEPENFKVLRMNAILNGVEDRIETIQAAISDTDGTAVLQVSSRNSGAHSLSGGEVRAIGTVEVPTLSFDGMVDRGQLDADAASLLWMDIEGYEIHALMGGRSLLERSVPVVMELNPPVLEAAGRADQLLPTLAPHYTHVAKMATSARAVSAAPFGRSRLSATCSRSRAQRRSTSWSAGCRERAAALGARETVCDTVRERRNTVGERMPPPAHAPAHPAHAPAHPLLGPGPLLARRDPYHRRERRPDRR